MLGAGCGIRFYRFLIIAFLSTYLQIYNQKCLLITSLLMHSSLPKDRNIVLKDKSVHAHDDFSLKCKRMFLRVTSN